MEPGVFEVLVVRSARSYGPLPDRRPPLKTAFSEPRAESWSNWRGAPAVLLRGAVVLGFAAVGLAAVSGAFMPAERTADPSAEAPAAARLDAVLADAPPAAVAEAPLATAPSQEAATPASVDPAAQAAPLAERMAVAEPAPLPQAPPAEQAGAPAPSPAAQAASASPPQPQPVELAPAPPPPQPDAEAEMVTAAIPVRPTPMERPAAGGVFEWPERAVHCPRDWIIGALPSAGAAMDCEAATSSVAAAPAEQSALDTAAARRADEFAAANFVAPIPKPRPDPPARVVRTSTRARLPPPPNCGTKHAYYRYNAQRQPVWYCR